MRKSVLSSVESDLKDFVRNSYQSDDLRPRELITFCTSSSKPSVRFFLETCTLLSKNSTFWKLALYRLSSLMVSHEDSLNITKQRPWEGIQTCIHREIRNVSNLQITLARVRIRTREKGLLLTRDWPRFMDSLRTGPTTGILSICGFWQGPLVPMSGLKRFI